MLKMAPAVAEPTLLGLCDGELDPQRHRTSFLTNKVGGRPDWIPALTRPRPCCRRCGAPSLLVVQVYCPLDTSPYHRNLHLFACPVADCGGGADAWTVLRSQCLEAEAAQASGPPGPPVPVQAAPLTATDWCAAADDWGEEEDGWGEGDERKNSEGQVEEPPAVTEARDERRGTLWIKVVSGEYAASSGELLPGRICPSRPSDTRHPEQCTLFTLSMF